MVLEMRSYYYLYNRKWRPGKVSKLLCGSAHPGQRAGSLAVAKV